MKRKCDISIDENIQKKEIIEELSECCGASTNGDYKFCESCGEHC